MKKNLLLLAMMLIGVSAWGQETVAVGTDVAVSQIENGTVYTIQGYRTQWRYMYFDGTNYDTRTTTTAYSSELENANNYKWTFYKSANNVWYLYCLGAQRFLGTSSSSSTIPLVENGPVSTGFIVQDSEVADATAIMMSSDNGGAAMHCANKGNSYKIMNWTGAYSNMTSAECAFKVTKIGDLDDVTLQLIENAVNAYEAPIIIPAKLAELNAIVEKLENYEPYIGTGYGKYTCSNENFVTIIDQLRTFHTEQTANATASVADIDEKINEANLLIQAVTINTPADGSFLRITRSVDENSYLIGENNANRTKFAADMGEDASSIFYYTEGKLLSYKTGKYLTATSNMLHYTTTVGAAAGTTIDFIESKTVGAYCVVFANKSRYLYASGNGNSDGAGSDGDENYRFSLQETTILPVTVGTTTYVSFYAPVAVTLPAGLKAYYVSAASSTKATMEEVGSVIPANTGVILHGEPNTYNLTIGGTAEAIDENKLLGTVASEYKTDDAYVLAAKDDNVAGFYVAEKNISTDNTNDTEETTYESFLNNGFKAYLPASVVPSEARFLSFDFGTETGIVETENGNHKTENSAVYDLAGRRVKAAQKGLYIVDGKKVVK